MFQLTARHSLHRPYMANTSCCNLPLGSYGLWILFQLTVEALHAAPQHHQHQLLQVALGLLGLNCGVLFQVMVEALHAPALQHQCQLLSYACRISGIVGFVSAYSGGEA